MTSAWGPSRSSLLPGGPLHLRPTLQVQSQAWLWQEVVSVAHPGVWNSPSVASPLVDGLRWHHGSAIALSSSGRMTKLQGSIEIGLGQWHGKGNHVTVTSGQSPRSQPVLGHALFFSHIRPASGEDIKWILHSRRVKMSWKFLSQFN